MPNSAPERNLRRLIDDLASLREEDAAAILEDLGPMERQTVDGLLREHAQYAQRAEPPVDHAGYDASRFSPWLAERLQGGDAGPHRISAASQQALRTCAARLYPLAKTTTEDAGLIRRGLRRRRTS